MHLSSLPIMVTFFYKKKYYYALLALIFIVTPTIYFVLKYFLHDLASFQKIIFKVNSYSKGMDAIGVLHKLFFLFISVLLILGAFLYKKVMLNPIIITVVLFYYLFFFINPIAGYRFSPYLLFALFLFDFDDTANEKGMSFLNYASILLLPCFLYTLYDTHLL
jgi:hypothetical protein